MAKVFDENGNIVDAGSDVILNDLTMAPIMDAMPTDVPVYYAIVVPAADGKFRIALIMPKVIATVRMLQTNVDALGKRIDNIQVTPGPAGPVGSQGPQGIAGAKGSDGQQGLTGAKGDTGATALLDQRAIQELREGLVQSERQERKAIPVLPARLVKMVCPQE